MLDNSCALNSPSLCIACLANSPNSCSSWKFAVAKAHVVFAISWGFADLTMGTMCAAMLRKSFAFRCLAVAKAHAVVAKQRKPKHSACWAMCDADALKTALEPNETLSMAPSFASAHKSVDNSNGLKKEILVAARAATLSINILFVSRIVAKDQTMLLKDCDWDSPIVAAQPNVSKIVARTESNVGCRRRFAWLSGSFAVSFASLCTAVVKFTKFIYGKCMATVLNKCSMSPYSDALMICWLIHGNPLRPLALAPPNRLFFGLAWTGFLPPRPPARCLGVATAGPVKQS
mmetsp:Transcript_122089/g.352896  ORF Transcript_122089/g.352896 Transcript_122089/m.352896 type:complete len:289 (-) Transcript_122089:176-1042(-)